MKAEPGRGFPAGMGEMAERIRRHDWAATPLGPIGSWPQSLRTVVELMLASREPVYIAWGPELTSLYNESYVPILGSKNTWALGQPFAKVFAEIWEEYRPLVEATLAGDAQHFVDHPVPLAGREGRPMSWFTFSWTPLCDEAGRISGFYCVATETTDKVLAEQALRNAQEAALRESEQQRGAALAAARLGTFEWNLATDAVSLDARSREILGFAPEEGRCAPEVFGRIHPEDFPRARAEAQASINRLSRLETEFRIRLPDGGIRIVACLGDAVPGPDGRAGRMVGMFADITERRRAEEALRESQAETERLRRLYEAILTNTPDLAYVFDLDHRFIYANEGLLRMWGRSREEAIGRTCLELGYEPWHAAMHDREIEQVIATRQPVRGTVPFTGTFGRRIYDYIFVPVIGLDGRVEAVAGTTRDVTELKQAEQALRESEVRLAAALSAARMAAWRWDPAEDRVTFSDTAAEVFGLPPGETIRSSEQGMLMVHPDDAERHRALVREATVRGTSWHAEFRIIRPRDGRIAWLEERATAERDPVTGELRMAGLIWDITERKEAEERQRLLSREVDHRAKNALAVVQAALRLTEAPDLPSYRRAIEGRVAALARAQTLLAGDRWEGADLRRLLEGELAPFLGDGSAGGPRVELGGPAILLPAGAAQPLAMAVHELATNSVKYGALSATGGTVSLFWKIEGGARGTLRLHWTEAGGPPIAGPPPRRGFGSRVLEGTVGSQLGGAVAMRWEKAGLTCTMEIPLVQAPASVATAAD